MSDYYLGIDGGGTKTHAVILQADGHLVGEGTAGSSNINNIGVKETRQNIQEAVSLAAAEAGLDMSTFASAFLGIAGVVSQADQAVVQQIAEQLNLAPANRTGVDHDCRIALAGGLGGAPGIVQIIGTGSSCFGLTSAGKRWMAGGWGHLIADEGGGYWLGIQALKAATAAYDGRGDKTLLHDMILQALVIDSIEQIMQRVYTEQLSVSDIAALGRLVIEAARQEDQVAQKIIEAGMNEAAHCIAAVARHLAFPEDELRLVCIGGILQAGDIIMTRCKGFTQIYHSVPNYCFTEWLLPHLHSLKIPPN